MHALFMKTIRVFDRFGVDVGRTCIGTRRVFNQKRISEDEASNEPRDGLPSLKIFKICRLQSVSIFSILVSLWFAIISLVLFYLNVLFHVSIHLKVFLRGQNYSNTVIELPFNHGIDHGILFRYLVCSLQWHRGWTLISVALECHSSSPVDRNTRYIN